MIKALPRLPALAALCFGALVALFLLGAPAAAQEAEPQTGEPSGQIGVGSAEIADDAIALRILRVLRALDGYDEVRVEVSSGVVTLRGEVVDREAVEALERVVTRVEGVVAIENRVTETADLGLRLAPAWERLRTRAAHLLVTAPIFLVAIAAFLAILGLGWLATTRIGIWDRIAPNAFIAEIYRTLGRIGFGVAGLVVALDILNATALIGAVLGAAGVVGLAVGFAVRDTVENFIASVLLSLRQPFRPMDFVNIDGVEGSVARLTSRATILISPDGNQIRIPNATVYKGTIVNFTRDPERRFILRLAVDGTTDLASALATGTEALRALPFVLADPPVSAWIDDVTDGRAMLDYAGWTDQTRVDFGKARSEAIRTVKLALEEAGVALAEPALRVSAPAREAPPRTRPAGPAARAALPEAATPERPEVATAKAVERERRARDSDGDLLRPDAGPTE